MMYLYVLIIHDAIIINNRFRRAQLVMEKSNTDDENNFKEFVFDKTHAV